jgi:RNA polymerase sigma-70 factor (ECF subfamily)
VDTAELIRRARSGDQAALGQLLAHCREQLRAQADQSLDSRVKVRLDASDLVQQTCLSVVNQIEHFVGDDAAQFAAWLRQIHERNILNAVRQQRDTQARTVERDEPLRESGVVAGGPAPSQLAMQQEEAVRLEAALARLPPLQGDVLRLRYFQGHTLEQVAGQLGVTREAIVWQMQLGLKQLRRWLAEPPPQHPR